jgi:dGTPase
LDFINLNEKILNQIRVTLSNKYTEYKKLTNHDIQGSLYKIFSEFFEDSYEKTVTKIQKDNVKDLYVQSILLMNSYYSRAKLIVQDGYERTFFSSHLVKKFMNGVRFNYNSKNPELSYAYFESETKLIVEVLKTFNYINIINSPMLKVSEHRGKEIIKKIFEAIDKNIDLMPDDHQLIYNNSNDEFKKRTICDFISGMTDRYAVEYYSRLYSSQPESIFKPF